MTLDTIGGSRGSFGGFGGQTSAGSTLLIPGVISGAGALTIKTTPLNGGQSPINGTVVLAAALELENLDLNELEAVLNDIEMALARHVPSLVEAGRD